MIDLAEEALQRRPQLATLPWADLGTGSGALAIGLADLLARYWPAPNGGSGTAGSQPVVAQQGAARIASAPRLGIATTDSSSKSSSNAELQCSSSSSGAADSSTHPVPSVTAVDLSPTAVAYAAHNAALCGVSDRIRVAQGSWFEPLAGMEGRLGGVLSNPPYIPRVQMAGLQAEVGRHEPWTALDGGPGDGLDSLAPICAGAATMLAPGGFLALETAGRDQAAAVASLLRRATGTARSTPPFVDVKVVIDCFGVERFVTAYRNVAD